MKGQQSDEWHAERMKHPYHGEGLTKDAIMGSWESMSQTYDGAGYDTIRGNAISDLLDMGVLTDDASLLDIGCGPGLFAIPLSRHVRTVYGMDASAGMLDRLAHFAESEGSTNVRPLHSDWEDFIPEQKYDIAFASLCPPTNNPESLLKMESCSKRHCVYMSSINEADGIHVKIWRRLGKDYSFRGYNTQFPKCFLGEIGREVEMRTYEQKSDKDVPYDKALEIEMKRMVTYRERTAEVEEAVRCVLDPMTEDGNVHYGDTMRIGMLVWKPG